MLSLVVKELLFEYRGVKNRICKKYNCYLVLSRLHDTCHRRGTLIVEEETHPKSLDHGRGSLIIEEDTHSKLLKLQLVAIVL